MGVEVFGLERIDDFFRRLSSENGIFGFIRRI